jgi:hypothetical protein
MNYSIYVNDHLVGRSKLNDIDELRSEFNIPYEAKKIEAITPDGRVITLLHNLTIPNINNIKSATEARDLAIEWQSWQSEQSLYLSELIEWHGFFKQLAKKYKLKTEFIDNGII